MGFAIFIVGWIFNTVVGGFGFPFSANVFYGNNGELYYALFLLLPWNPFSKGMRDLGRATPTPDSPGLAWSERDSYCRNPRRDGAPIFVGTGALQSKHRSACTIDRLAAATAPKDEIEKDGGQLRVKQLIGLRQIQP